ncbi:MAG TPA: phosphate/phosphite/phosphonate ABC transporter substrate-binding protein [Puia sp.]|jgi:phosphonate transport system substrate-binding protein|nr:phosphate/phosphite/phosphonate ABC transporter substrate-binding protein [Puia sp.]
MQKLFLILLVLLTLLSVSGCKNKRALDAGGNPTTLLVGAYAGDDPGAFTPIRDEVRKYLQKKLGIPVEFVTTTDYTSVIEAIVSKKVHMAYLSPFGYVLATRQTPLVPMVIMGSGGTPRVYQSIIITRSGNGINSMEDVRSRSKNLTLCFADPASTSGHLIPRAYLTSIGLNPDSAFKQVLFAGTHMASILSVKAGKVDLGCTTALIINMLSNRGQMKPGDVKILWTSDPIVSDAIAMRPDINPAFTAKVRDAYLHLAEENPVVWKQFLSLFNLKSDSLGYVPAQDSMYDGLRRIAASVKDLKAVGNK